MIAADLCERLKTFMGWRFGDEVQTLRFRAVQSKMVAFKTARVGDTFASDVFFRSTKPAIRIGLNGTGTWLERHGTKMAMRKRFHGEYVSETALFTNAFVPTNPQEECPTLPSFPTVSVLSTHPSHGAPMDIFIEQKTGALLGASIDIGSRRVVLEAVDYGVF